MVVLNGCDERNKGKIVFFQEKRILLLLSGFTYEME